MIGSSFAHFRITAKLGQGGMGEVYRATDGRLQRDVAIKLLPESFCSDPERLARFQHEAQLLASLNHPNIGQVYGLEEADGSRAIVLELIEGEDLSDRIARGALPVEQALQTALQIAEALEAAHERGIVHRDLKPANVRVTPDGVVKVLDFGLAKALEPTESQHDPTDSPTLTMAATQAGLILGTASYMSPEQAAGQAADRQADIWSFGVVLWEMLTGKRLFVGETVSHVLAAVLKDEPDYADLPAGTPPQLVRLIRRSLRKKPRQRLQAIGDARIVIEELLSGEQLDAGGDGAAASAPLAATGRSFWRPVAAALAVGALLTLGAVALTGGFSRSTPTPTIRASLDLPPTLELDAVDRAIALSPDGSQLALVATDTGTGIRQIYLRSLDNLESRPLAGTEGASYPFWSPDGSALGFFADVKLKRMDLAGGIVRTLCDAPAGRGAAWSRHGFIVFAPTADGALFQVSDEGGNPEPFTTLGLDGESHRLPHFLPDGHAIVYTHLAGPKSTSFEADASSWEPVNVGTAVYSFRPDTGAARKVLDAETEAFYVEPGYLAYVQDSNLMLQPFDLDALESTGEPRPIATNVQSDSYRMFLQLGVVAGGTLVYQEIPENSGVRLAWLDRRGEETPIPAEPLRLLHARVSPDGRRAAVEISDSQNERSVEQIDFERGIRNPINPPGTWAASPAWSPAGDRLAFETLVAGQFQLAVMGLRPGDEPVALTQQSGMGGQYPAGFTPDGQILFSRRSNVDKRGDLMIVDVSGGSQPTPFLADPSNDSHARLSPNGHWVVFATFPAGMDPLTGFQTVDGATLSISDYPTTGRWQITRPDADVRAWGWLSDQEVYWQNSEGRTLVVTIMAREGGDPIIGTPQLLLDGRRFADEGSRIVDYSFARQQFLVVRRAGPVTRARLVVLSDWRVRQE